MLSIFTRLSIALGVFMLAASAFADNPGSPVGISDAVYIKAGLFFYSANCVLTAIRQILSKFDGIDPVKPLPADAPKSLTVVNKLCILVGKAVDFIIGNPAH